MNAIEVFYLGISEELSELIIAELSEKDFHSFWQDEDGLRAYIDGDKLNEEYLYLLASKYGKYNPLQFSIQSTTPENWGKVKEEHYKPFIIAEKITIYSSVSEVEYHNTYQLVLNDQMAFGSGKHPSTALSLQAMLSIDFSEKIVVDVGTGTAILAVLASKMGAKEIHAFDNNPWAIEVAAKTLFNNSSNNISVEVSEIDAWVAKGNTYEVVLANLNIMVFNSDFMNVIKLISTNGKILVGGIMLKDESSILQQASINGLIVIARYEAESWVVILFELKTF